MKYNVEIPEVHKALVEVELLLGATREEIVAKAKQVLEENGSDILEYSETLMDDEYIWTITELDDKGCAQRYIE